MVSVDLPQAIPWPRLARRLLPLWPWGSSMDTQKLGTQTNSRRRVVFVVMVVASIVFSGLAWSVPIVSISDSSGCDFKLQN